MTFAEHIQNNIFKPRLKDNRILVVYDENDRYKDICQKLEGERCKVILTEKRPVSSRQDAMERWMEMASDTTYQNKMVIHCVDPAPKDDDARQQHPFASYAAVGAAFPSKASDDYKQLCYGFLKDRTAEIDQLFETGNVPSFELIDNLSEGTHSRPRLQQIFMTADASKIIPDFLAPPPTKAIDDQLNANDDWSGEMHMLLQQTLGLTINAQATTVETIRKKLWQYLLISEFANDLPCALPSSLQDMQRASGPQLNFALSLCVDLRKHGEKKEVYREAANEVEASLNLADECQQMANLGDTDTFSFEEKHFLYRAATAIRANEWDQARAILEKHKDSLWTEEGERKLLWRILELALETLEYIKRSEEQLKHLENVGKQLCDLYAAELIKVDRTYRELEEATAQTVEGHDEIESIVESTRKEYRTYFNAVEQRLLTIVAREGWPLKNLKRNIDSYDELVAPALKESKKVAYFLIDALRLDLAQDLESSIQGHQVTSIPACTQLPCVTRFGMASLMPEANTCLRFVEKDGELAPVHKDKEVATRQARLKVFESTLNDRVETSNLSEFIKVTKTAKMRENYAKRLAAYDLLVITSTELDNLGEGLSTSQLQHIPTVMRDLQLAISRCAGLGFDMAVVATDHGFLWIEDIDAGTVCDIPPGDWKALKKRRCLIGKGDETPGTARFSTKDLSIPTDSPSFVVPKALATFSKGTGYFHEGLSLQESIVARLVVTYIKQTQPKAKGKNPEIELSRKKKTVSSRIVAINVSWPGTPDMFSEGFEFKLVATQNKIEVGFPTSGEHVDSSTNLVKMKQSESLKLNLRLNEGVKEGTIQVKAINPETEFVINQLELTFKPTVF